VYLNKSVIFVQKTLTLPLWILQIPLSEYQLMQEESALLRSTELLEKMNRLVDLLFQAKCGLYMQDYTEDLTAYSLNNASEKEEHNS